MVSNWKSFYRWERIAELLLISRGLDATEEQVLLPQKEIFYQFSAGGHDLAQLMLADLLRHPRDAAGAYYRSRPLLLGLGLTIDDAFAGPMGRSGGFSDGRDIGVVCNLPTGAGAKVLPMAGDVGSQYTPIAGWAQAIRYYETELRDRSYEGAIGVALGGDASVATSGFWSALTMATTLSLPMLFFIEDNGFGLSVAGTLQTPGANIAKNLASFQGLTIHEADGTDPAVLGPLLFDVVNAVRHERRPILVRVEVPRLSGHSGQDNQAYKSAEVRAAERARDPLPKLRSYTKHEGLLTSSWEEIEKSASAQVAAGLEAARARPHPQVNGINRYVYTELAADGRPEIQVQGGQAAHQVDALPWTLTPEPTGDRINLVMAVRRTLEHELSANPRVLVFGEDVGRKGGVHAATLGLQDRFGEARVFDTSLSEEGIIGRSVGMALAGLVPVPEIQFRKYADPATEQLNNCGTIRWRTNNRWAAPIVVRMPGGFFRCGDPWHSLSNEVQFARAVGWQVAYPSNAEDAVGLLRAAMRSNEPTLFFEHRYLLDAAEARRPYPGDTFVVPCGAGKLLRRGHSVTVVSWGAMVWRCEEALEGLGISADHIDLRSLAPWDRALVLDSVRRTGRCLIVHEDTLTAGFGAEIAAVVQEECFGRLKAPVRRVAVADIPVPYSPVLMNGVVPSVAQIRARLEEIMA